MPPGLERLECGELVVVNLRSETALREQTDKNQRPPETFSSAVCLLHTRRRTTDWMDSGRASIGWDGLLTRASCSWQ